MEKDRLKGKKILIVDDEPDIISSIAELLPDCEVLSATTFIEAKRLIETSAFDIVLLDIMGVNGYELLNIAKEKKIVAVMLTAHALSPEDLVRSRENGAAYFVPKEAMSHIATYLNDVLEAKEKGKNLWSRWYDRFADYFDKKFGPDWQKDHWMSFR